MSFARKILQQYNVYDRGPAASPQPFTRPDPTGQPVTAMQPNSVRETSSKNVMIIVILNLAGVVRRWQAVQRQRAQRQSVRLNVLKALTVMASGLAPFDTPAQAQRAPDAPTPSQTPAIETRVVPSPAAPELGTGFATKPRVTANRFMVVAANPLAVDAGYAMLAQGGSAIDAAIAVQLVLNIVEPQSSGMGGGAFLLHYARASRRLTTYDGRERAPAAARAERFFNADGTVRAFPNAVFGGLSVGVPGVVRLMATTHQAHGRLPWDALFVPAIKHAREGFAVSGRLHALLKAQGATAFEAKARELYFAPDGAPHPIGHNLKNPEFAATLDVIARQGADAFYNGPIAAAIVAAVRDAPNHHGDLTIADLANYRVAVRRPECAIYRKLRICGMGPPSSGGIAVLQTLKLIEPFDLGTEPLNAEALHVIAEAQKLAYADRDRFIGDPDFVAVPQGLLNRDYLTARRSMIRRDKVMPKAEPGNPPGAVDQRAGLDTTIESPGTSHISIIDGRGNAVAMTTTIENAFGSRILAAGFLLNNQLTDFAFNPRDSQDRPLANAIAPGKRPRSSMAPMIAVDRVGRVRIVTGSPGGSRIILYVVKTIVGIVDWKLDAQKAADLANFGSRNGPLEIEATAVGISAWRQIALKGHSVRHEEMTSGVHSIVRLKSGKLEAGIDPRREGAARGK